ALEKLSGFHKLTDLVLVCDSAEDSQKQFTQLCRYINHANRSIGRDVYEPPALCNTISRQGVPRIHILAVPQDKKGGLETICVEVARDNLNTEGATGTEIESWVDKFADDACKGWTTEKRDKLRLQAFLSAAWKKKPEVHFSQLFD